MKVYKETPISEITLRKFEKPHETGDNLIRKFCISLGLLQPGDSRDTIIEVIKILLNNRKNKALMNSDQIHKLLQKEIASSNIRRHLNRLEKIGIIERLPEGYRIREWMNLKEIMDEHIKKFIIDPSFDRIKEYAEKIDSTYF
jgi:predicted transcriptional regulator